MKNKTKKMKNKTKLNMVIRENTLDQFVINESDYERCDFQKEDIWLDAGGNIGAFACKYAKKVKQIISYEPDLTNFTNLKANLILNEIENCLTFNDCIVENEDEKRKFYLNNKKNKGTHSLHVVRGREEVEVSCVNINKIISEFDINKIKMDVEGSEYDLLKVLNFENIKEIILEYHFNVLRDIEHKTKYYELIDILKNNNFQVDYRDDLKKSWTTIIYAKKS
jgi:FkbM family methyltransferase